MNSAVWIDLYADLVRHGCTSFVSLVIGPIGLYLVATLADFFWARQVAGISADQLPAILVGLGQIVQQVLHSQSPYNGNVNEKRLSNCVLRYCDWSGSRTTKSAPQPGPSLCATTVPSCSSTRDLTIARPMPKPLFVKRPLVSAWLKKSKMRGQ